MKNINKYLYEPEDHVHLVRCAIALTRWEGQVSVGAPLAILTHIHHKVTSHHVFKISISIVIAAVQNTPAKEKKMLKDFIPCRNLDKI